MFNTGDILVWKVQILALEEEASSMTFNSTDKLSISDSQLNPTTGQYGPLTSTSINDIHMKRNSVNNRRLQLFGKVILHNSNTHTFNSYEYNENEEIIVLKYNLSDALIFS